MRTGEKRTFKIVMSERCYRFKPDALPSHAPQKPGVYEFVTFDAAGNPTVLYVGLALEKTMYESLSEHLMGRAEPTAARLFATAKDIYFDYVASANISAAEDFKDIAGALIAKHRPRLNAPGSAPFSGKYSEVSLEEVE